MMDWNWIGADDAVRNVRERQVEMTRWAERQRLVREARRRREPGRTPGLAGTRAIRAALGGAR